jgi:hypothetical protein
MQMVRFFFRNFWRLLILYQADGTFHDQLSEAAESG